MTIAAFLQQKGFVILHKAVHGKNQTRFWHFVLERNDQKFFCKVNKYDDGYESHNNSSISKYFSKPPQKIRFINPVETFVYNDSLLHLYPFIALPAVSNESKDFSDFNVPDADSDAYLQTVIAAIRFVAAQKIVSTNESSIERSFDDSFLKLIERLRTEIPHAVEHLKYLLHEGHLLQQKTLAINDIQPQNMFWEIKSKELFIFDLEHLGPNFAYYDFARFSSYVWFVHQKPDLAERFLQLAFADLSHEQKAEQFRYIKFCLVWTLINDFAVFKADTTRKYILSMLAWVRKDFLHFVNQ